MKPDLNKKMPVKGGYRKSEESSYCHGGPSGSELPPVLNGVECCKCGKEMGKSYRAPGGKPWCGCIERERYAAIMDGTAVLSKQEAAAGWHFCCEWDELLIGPGMGELDACGCPGVAIERERRLIREAQC